MLTTFGATVLGGAVVNVEDSSVVRGFPARSVTAVDTLMVNVVSNANGCVAGVSVTTSSFAPTTRVAGTTAPARSSWTDAELTVARSSASLNRMMMAVNGSMRVAPDSGSIEVIC